jgi:hypothetical protein
MSSKYVYKATQYGQSQSESKWMAGDKDLHGITVHAQNQLKFPHSDPSLLSKSTSKCECCEVRFTS